MEVPGWHSAPRSSGSSDISPLIQRRSVSVTPSLSPTLAPQTDATVDASVKMQSISLPASLVSEGSFHKTHSSSIANDSVGLVYGESVPVFTGTKARKDLLHPPTFFTDHVQTISNLAASANSNATAGTYSNSQPHSNLSEQTLSVPALTVSESASTTVSAFAASSRISSTTSSTITISATPVVTASSTSISRIPTRPWLPSQAVSVSQSMKFLPPVAPTTSSTSTTTHNHSHSHSHSHSGTITITSNGSSKSSSTNHSLPDSSNLEHFASVSLTEPKPHQNGGMHSEPFFITPPSSTSSSASSTMSQEEVPMDLDNPPLTTMARRPSNGLRRATSAPSSDAAQKANLAVPITLPPSIEITPSGDEPQDEESESDHKGAVAALKITAKRKRRASIAVWTDPRLVELAQGTAFTSPTWLSSTSTQSSIQDELDYESSAFDVLSKSVLIKILSFLDTRQRLIHRRVCKQWMELITSPILASQVDLSSSHKKVNDVVLATVGSVFGKHIRYLNLRNCWHISDAGLRSITTAAPGLEVIDLNSCWELTDAGVAALGKNCSKLKCLDLSNCKKMMDTTVTELLKSLPTLLELKVCYCKSLTNTSMETVIKFGRNLRVLNLQRCTGISDLGFLPMRELSTKSFLSVLVLSDCSFLTDETIQSIAIGCPVMRILNLSFCCALTPLAVDYLVRGCPQLESLDMSFCGAAVTDEMLHRLAVSEHRLTKLSVRGCVLMTDAGLKSLVLHANHLTTLNISSCKGVSEEAIKTVPKHWKLLPGNVPLDNLDTLGVFTRIPNGKNRRLTN